MKKLVLIIFLFFFLIFNNLYFSAQLTLDNTTDIVLYKSYETYKIFEELYNLINNNKMSNKVVFETIDYIKKKIEKNELLLLIDHKNESKYILTGAFFVAVFDSQKDKTKEKPYILFNKNIIDIFYYQKSIVFSMLMHEIKHAYDYYTNYGLFKVTYNNLLEKYMFQMDALYLEALLIENILVPNNYTLTDFENILLKSHKEDNLSSYSLIYENVSKDLIYFLYGLQKNKESYESNFRQIIEVGNKLINDFNNVKDFYKAKDEQEEWKNFLILTTLSSFLVYVNQIAYNIIYTKHKEMEPNQFDLNVYSPEIYKITNKILDLLSPKINLISNYKEKNLKIIENIYERYLEESTKSEYLIFNNNFVFLHIIPSDLLEIRNNVKPYQYLGSVENMPLKLSMKYDFLIKKSINLYNEKKYKEAAKVLELAVKNEPENPFILNFYAKALYWFDNDNSFLYYKKLIDMLDSQMLGEKYLELKNLDNNLSEIKNDKFLEEIKEIQLEMKKVNNNKILVDLWFTEAYWKLGTLYLDRGDFLKGVYEITRSMVTLEDNDLIKEQAYSYLCESYCILNKPEIANYCKEKVFKINPNNTYILKFLDKLKTNQENKDKVK